MSTRGAVDCDAGTPADGTEGTLHFGAFREHRFTVELADVVQIDVDRQARSVENEQVERGAALQRKTPLEIRMAIEPVKEIEEQGDLFEDLRVLQVPRLGPARDLRVRRVLRHRESDCPPVQAHAGSFRAGTLQAADRPAGNQSQHRAG